VEFAIRQDHIRVLMPEDTAGAGGGDVISVKAGGEGDNAL